MKEYKDIPIFQYGMNPNNVFISREVVIKALDGFVGKPIFEFNENDLYNKEQNIVGVIKKVTRLDNYNSYVYGDILIYNKEEPINQWKNYEILIENSHNEDDKKTIVVDNFNLNSIGYRF